MMEMIRQKKMSYTSVRLMDVSFTKTGLAIWFIPAIRSPLRKSRPVGAENLIPYCSGNKFVPVDETAWVCPWFG
jgi:hypothetical protein